MMYQSGNKQEKDKGRSTSDTVSQKQTGSTSVFQFAGDRPEAIQLWKLQKTANKSPGIKQLKVFQETADDHVARQLHHKSRHVVQQQQGSVRSAVQMKGTININDDARLEKEADAMGAEALKISHRPTKKMIQKRTFDSSDKSPVQRTEIFRGFTSVPGTRVEDTQMFNAGFILDTMSKDDKEILEYIVFLITRFSEIETRSEWDNQMINKLNLLKREYTSKMPLDHELSVREYVNTIKSSKDLSQKSGKDKIVELNSIFIQKFNALNIPPPRINILNSESKNGEFDSKNWSFGITKKALEETKVDWAATAYHEARHAEQFFMIARLLVHEKIAPPHSNQIPGEILERAQHQPPLKGSEKEKAEVFYNSIFGKYSEHRNTTLKMLGEYTLTKVGEAGTTFKLNLNDYNAKYEICKNYAEKYKKNALNEGKDWPDQQQARNIEAMKLAREILEISRLRFLEIGEKQKKSHENYLELPEEKEAHRLGDMVREQLNEL